MRRNVLAAAARLQEAVVAPQGLHQLFGSTGTAATAAAAAAAAARAQAAPLLVRTTPRSTAAAAAQQQHRRGLAGLLPQAARATTAGHAAAAPCWRAPTAAAAAAGSGRRGFAQMGTRMPKSGYTPPAEMQRAMQMRLSMVSSNLLAEPYRGVPPRQPLSAYFSVAGWKEVWRRFMSQVKSLYTLARCKKFIAGFSRPAFKAESLALYKEINGLLAAGDKSALRQLVTPAVFSDMKRQLKQREDGGWARVHWELVREPTADEVTAVHGRLIMIDPKDDSTGFAQLTVRVPSTQRFAAFNRAGNLVAGSLDQGIEVEDYWVFEHALKPSPANRWRLAGRLTILPDATQQQQQQQQASVGAGAAAGSAQQQQQQQQQQPAPQQQAGAASQTAQPEPRVGHVADQQMQAAHPAWGAKPAAARRRQAAGAGRGRR